MMPARSIEGIGRPGCAWAAAMTLAAHLAALVSVLIPPYSRQPCLLAWQVSGCQLCLQAIHTSARTVLMPCWLTGEGLPRTGSTSEVPQLRQESTTPLADGSPMATSPSGSPFAWAAANGASHDLHGSQRTSSQTSIEPPAGMPRPWQMSSCSNVLHGTQPMQPISNWHHISLCSPAESCMTLTRICWCTRETLRERVCVQTRSRLRQPLAPGCPLPLWTSRQSQGG